LNCFLGILSIDSFWYDLQLSFCSLSSSWFE
jgi:hypothetical protein